MNPFDPNYLLTARDGFETAEWLLFGVLLAALGAGVYLALGGVGGNPLLQQRLRQLGYGLALTGGLGTLAGLLWLVGVAPLNQPVWMVLATVMLLIVGGVATYYFTAVYAREKAAQREQTRSTKRAPRKAEAAAAPRGGSGGGSALADDASAAESVTKGGRRESRARRKRKTR